MVVRRKGICKRPDKKYEATCKKSPETPYAEDQT